MRHGSLFSGIGGFDLAARWMGWENAFHAEIDPFCLQILKYHFPDAVTYTDIRNTDFTPWRDRIDVLSGGFPCQPFSQAGKRKGTSDDRHLWPEMLRAIREIRPRWVVGENVLGITNWDGGVVFDQVCADLESEGYSVQPVVLPACGVNAPHQRHRTWFTAHRDDDELFAGLPLPEQIWAALASDGGAVTDPYCDGDRMQECGGSGETQRDEEQVRTDNGSAGEPCGADSLGNERRDPYRYVSDNTGGYSEVRYHCETAADTEHMGFERGTSEGSGEGDNTPQRCDVFNGSEGLGSQRASADTQHCSLQDDGVIGGSMGEEDSGQATGRSQYGDLSKDWLDFPTVSPVCGRDDGISKILHGITFPRWRKESIKAYGNAIVPQVAYRIFRVIQYMSSGE